MLQELDIRDSSSSEDESGDGVGAGLHRANMSRRQLSSAPDRKRASAAASALMRARATELEVNAILNHSTSEGGPGYDEASSPHSCRAVPNVLTSTTDTGSSGAESYGGGGSAGRGALDDEGLDAMLSDLVGRRSGGSSNEALQGHIRARNGAPTSVLAMNDTHNNDDSPSVASSLGMSHEDTSHRFSGAHDVDVSRISHSSRRSRNTNTKASARDQTIASLERELQASKQAVDVLLRQRSDRNEEVTKATLEAKSLATKKDAIEQERNDLRAELKAMRARLAESDAIIDQQLEVIQHNEAEVQLYEKRKMQISDELEALRTERDDLHADLVAGCDEATSYRRKLEDTEAEISALRSENAALKADLSDKCSESKSNEDSRKAGEAEVAKLRAERDKLRSVRATAESLKRDKEDLTASVGEKAELIGKLKRDLAAERKQKQASRQEAKAARDTNAELQSQAELLTEENESFKRQLGDLQRSFADLKQGNSDAHAILSELEDAHVALAAMGESLASSEREKECLVEAATELEEELSRAKEDRAYMDAKSTALTQESEESRVSLRNLTEELTNEKSKSTFLSEELEDAKATLTKLKDELEIIRSDKETAETDYMEVLAQLENAKAQLADAKINANAARTDAADGIGAFERRLREKLEGQLNKHRAALETLQLKHEDETASLQKKYDELISSSALEKDEEISTLRTEIIDLEQSLQKIMEDTERNEEQMAQELAQAGGWLEKSKQREEATATELKKLQALSEDTIRQSEAAFDSRLEEELEIQRLAYEASAQTIEVQNRATMAAKVRSLQEEMQSRGADGKKVIKKLVSELDEARAEVDTISAEAEEAYSKADRLELEAATLRKSLRMLEKQNSALIKGRERVHLTSAATQTDSVPKEAREMGSQVDIANETDDGNMRRMEESLRQTKVELAAALTAFHLSEEEMLGSEATEDEATTLSHNIHLLRSLCKFVISEGPLGDSDLEKAWQSLGMLRRSVSQTNLHGGSIGPFDADNLAGKSPHGADEEAEDDASDADDDSILRNLTLSFDKAFAALKHGVELIDDDDQGGDTKREVEDGADSHESSTTASQALELVPRPPEQETSIVEFGYEREFETEGRLGIVLGGRPSLPHQLEYSIDRSNEEVAAIVKSNEEMLAIVPELQMRCDFLENERDVLLHEKEDLLNETLDLLETSRAESEAQIAAAVSMVRADALAEIARCKADYQQLMIKYREAQEQERQNDEEVEVMD